MVASTLRGFWLVLLLASSTTSTATAAATNNEHRLANAHAVVRMYVYRGGSSNNGSTVNTTTTPALEHRHYICQLEYDNEPDVTEHATATTSRIIPHTPPMSLLAGCCRSMFSASAAALGPTRSGTGRSMIILDECLAKAALVPELLPRRTTSTGRAMIRVSYIRTTTTAFLDFDEQSPRNDTKQRPQQRHEVFVWDSTGILTDGEWYDLGNASPTIRIQKALERRILPLRHAFHDDSDQDNNNWPVQLTSSLSQAGGMHRIMTHGLHVPWKPPPTQQLQQAESFQLFLDARIYLFVPDTMFIDVEDVFETNNMSDSNHPWNIVNATLITHQHGSIIDMEQPAMGSPQHVALVHIQASRTATTSANLDDKELVPTFLSFNTKWHTRYPAPITTTTTSPSYYRPIFITPPLFIQGSIQVTAKDGDDVIYPLHSTLADKPHLLFSPSHRRSNDRDVSVSAFSGLVLTTWVAAAPARDFEVVAILTVVCSLVGAAFVAYQMHAILRAKLAN